MKNIIIGIDGIITLYNLTRTATISLGQGYTSPWFLCAVAINFFYGDAKYFWFLCTVVTSCHKSGS